MIIYLDESKKLGEGQIVFGGFITKHSVSYINKFIENKKIEYGFNKTQIELKSIQKSGKIFYDRMITDSRFDIISNNIIGVSINGYFNDNKDKYIEILSILIGKIYNGIQIADLIAYELRQVNINKSKTFDDFILENMFNIDLSEIIEI